MATAEAQKKWRDKNRLLKKQLNVMARAHIHFILEDIAMSFRLRGKGEAVTFACFVTRALTQRADFNAETARMLDDFITAYHRDREIYSA
ncbi:MAG TPA: hypothetical protein QF509_07875 [Rhodospirillales bacterium]|jgi:hypothetical protein|nr:hypothetical protein [Rhodospirillales bacterium]